MSFFKTFKNDTWVKPYIKQYKGLLSLAIFLGFCTSFCAAALMFTSGYSIDKAATQPVNIFLIYVPILLTRAFGIGRPVFKYAERLRSHNWVLKITSELRTRLYRTLENDASFFNEKHRSGDIMGLLSEDINHLQDLYLVTVFPTVVAYLLSLFGSIAIGVFSPIFGLIIFLLILVEIFVVPVFSVLIESARREKQKSIKANLYSELTDNILGVDDWVISGRYDDFKNLSQKNLKELESLQSKSKKFRRNRDFVLQIVFAVIAVCFLIFTNIKFTNYQAQANFVAAIVLAIFPLSDAIIPVSQGFEEWPEYKSSINRLNSLKTEKVELPEQVDFDTKEFKDIELKNVNFTYNGTSSVIIENFSQKINRGQKVALLGPSGIGKTTILQLILGDLVANDGSVKVNGIDVSKLQNHRTEIFSVLNQNPFLFNTTILNNVRLGNENKSNSDVIEALDRVGLKDLIESLPDKYDTIVGENGERFSGGEQERIALARILLQDAPIVLLDEPSIGLDPITENKLLDTIFKVLKEKTIIWVTHHLQGVNYADHVIFMDDRKIEMQGSPKELYNSNEHFKDLYNMDIGI
ncbi:thiol reductant ABC exporter subunit CydC [Companilactobacillus metriopterae]|uniref:thiol reductant ABC exporter subunit CydC n=1 Tax=Companilactobacillus metriopterae TaxID=1909267 RepID=UPI00100B9F42|nr:thiol reductant ABC exporter subunit CydC [Companilactobacillus metriopterae]